MDMFLHSKVGRSFNGFHPWILDQSVVEPVSPPSPGQIVELKSASGQWIGRGIYNPNSRIRIRLYQWQRDAQLNDRWLTDQLELSVSLRQKWMARNGSLQAIRWVNSEGDGLSGLIIDQYGEYFVIQMTALAMLAWETDLVAWVAQRFHPKGIVVRMDANTAKAEGVSPRDDWVHGAAPTVPVPIQEFGVHLELNLVTGQKTGYYLDQRSNRIRAASWMSDGPLLDVCCYLGGFSLAAHYHAKPSSITAVDSSLEMLRQAEINANLNSASVDFVQADCFEFLGSLVESSQQFATVVLDPPRMASHRGQVNSALRAYHRLNLSAVNLLQPGGILVTCSCTGRVGRTDFIGVLASVAQRTRRSIQILENLGADFDHPVMAQCPEGEYLKCLICRVL